MDFVSVVFGEVIQVDGFGKRLRLVSAIVAVHSGGAGGSDGTFVRAMAKMGFRFK